MYFKLPLLCAHARAYNLNHSVGCFGSLESIIFSVFFLVLFISHRNIFSYSWLIQIYCCTCIFSAAWNHTKQFYVSSCERFCMCLYAPKNPESLRNFDIFVLYFYSFFLFHLNSVDGQRENIPFVYKPGQQRLSVKNIYITCNFPAHDFSSITYSKDKTDSQLPSRLIR